MSSLKRRDSNCRPLSVVLIVGMLNRAIHPERNVYNSFYGNICYGERFWPVGESVNTC